MRYRLRLDIYVTRTDNDQVVGTEKAHIDVDANTPQNLPQIIKKLINYIQNFDQYKRAE